MKFAIPVLFAILPLAAQEIKMPAGLDKLAAKASEVVDVSLDGALLQLASRFLSENDPDEAHVKRLVAGLKGIYVKSFEFEDRDEYKDSDIEELRVQLRGPSWSRIVSTRSKKDKENAEIFIKTDAGQISGLVVIATEARELTIVNIIGSIRPEDIRDLGGHMGIPRINLGPDRPGKNDKKDKDDKEDKQMKSLPVALIASLLLSVTAQAADREFTEVVRCISDEFHTRPTSIPMFGLVNLVAAVVRPAGTRHIDLAVFEHLNNRDREGRNLPESILNAVGRSWKPFVQVRSRRNGHEENVFVYMRQEGKDWKLLVTAIERDEATVVQLLLNPDALAKWMASPEQCARHWHGETD